MNNAGDYGPKIGQASKFTQYYYYYF